MIQRYRDRSDSLSSNIYVLTPVLCICSLSLSLYALLYLLTYYWSFYRFIDLSPSLWFYVSIELVSSYLSLSASSYLIHISFCLPHLPDSLLPPFFLPECLVSSSPCISLCTSACLTAFLRLLPAYFHLSASLLLGPALMNWCLHKMSLLTTWNHLFILEHISPALPDDKCS